MTTDLLAALVQKDRSTMYESLYTLEKQGYVLKMYDSSYRLRRLPARYSLASNGVKYLLTQGYGDASTLRYYYRNKSAKPEHIEHSLVVTKVFIFLWQHVSKTFTVLSGSEVAPDPDYLRPVSDLYLYRKKTYADKPDSFILEVLDKDKPLWKHTQRLKAHQKHLDESWQYDGYPTLLLVAPDYRTERYMLKVVENRWFRFDVWITHLHRLKETKNGTVWATEFDEDVELTKL